MLMLNNISAGYDGVDVLHDVSFTLKPGENVSIIGPNGCGKTTLLRAVAALIPFTGELEVSGRNIKKLTRADAAREIAMLSQITPVYFSLTVFETVMLGRYAHIPKGFLSRPRPIDYEKTEEALKTVHMQELKERELSTLSGASSSGFFWRRRWRRNRR